MQNFRTRNLAGVIDHVLGLVWKLRFTHFNARAAKCDACFSVSDLLVFIWELAATVGNSRMIE